MLSRAEGLRRTGRALPGAWTGTLGGRPVVLACAGDGAVRGARGLASLLETVPASAWIGAGFAGGLSPELAVGMILVVRKFRDRAGRFRTAPVGWSGRVLAGGGAVPGAVAAAGRIVATAAEKARMCAELPGGPEPWAVDLESLAWIAAASAAGASSPGLPGLIVRIISDTAEEDLPAFLPLCVDADGAIDRGSVALHALRHPSAVGKLLAMRRRARFCAEKLADYLEALAERAFADPA